MTEGIRPTPGSLTTQRTYSAARIVVLVILAIILGVAAMSPQDFHMSALLAGSAVLFVASLAGMASFRFGGTDIRTVLIWVAPFDLLALGLLVIALHNFEDPVFPALIALPIFYSFLLEDREGWVVSGATAFVYLVGHNLSMESQSWLQLLFVMFKMGAILFVGAVSSVWAAKLRQREEEVLNSVTEREDLNDQLRSRLAELQAVSQITELIHSSLDFDRVGPMVLDILTKVLGIEACALFVIDRTKATTLFSASVGMSSGVKPMPDHVGSMGEVAVSDSHFSCLSILDHKQMMVVFCTEAALLEQLSDEDRLVLQAVASELVVAVENSQLYKLTRRLAITDELTGLNNYRYLQQRLDDEIERARRYHKDLSLIMLDADNFKRFNDSQGHIAGDVALAELAMVLKERTREVDIVARYGGEEFSIILPETDAAGAFVAAEKIREAVALHDFPDADGERTQRMTVSLGLATYPTHAKDKESLLRMADDALYQAKNTGKDRVRSPLVRAPVASADNAKEGI